MIRTAAAALAFAVLAVPLGAQAAPDDTNRKEKIERRADAIAKRFERMDADKDGVVTRAEADVPAGKAFDRIDANKDGVVDEAEIKEHADKMRARMAKRGADESRVDKRAARFERADADKDGKVTRAEFLAKSLPWFERADADGDGKVTKDELAALTEKMQKRAERRTERSAN